MATCCLLALACASLLSAPIGDLAVQANVPLVAPEHVQAALQYTLSLEDQLEEQLTVEPASQPEDVGQIPQFYEIQEVI